LTRHRGYNPTHTDVKYFTCLTCLLFTIHSQAQQPVDARISGDRFLGVAGKSAELSFESESCTVASEKSDVTEFRLVFSCGKRSQTLWDINVPVPGDFAFDDPGFALIWAGDKDGDGKIDLIMEMSPKYSCTKEVTYLSTLAEDGQLVGIQGSPVTTCPD
jgi:hypothetical protein